MEYCDLPIDASSGMLESTDDGNPESPWIVIEDDDHASVEKFPHDGNYKTIYLVTISYTVLYSS